MAVGSLSQLVSPQSPVMLLAVREERGADGRYGFTWSHGGGGGGGGLVVDAVDKCHLRVGDRYDVRKILPSGLFTNDSHPERTL